jgi:nucleoside-diphosphate-sugar epimerase
VTDGDVAVVVGYGPLGAAVVRALDRRADRRDRDGGDAQIRVVTRSGEAAVPDGVNAVAADVSDAEAAAAAFAGASRVFLCASPPYRDWPDLWPPLMDGVVAGAERAGATVVFGDNLYAYGPVDGPVTEDLPHEATGPKGRVRTRVAEDLLAAHDRGVVEATIGRASDFYGPGVRTSLLGERVFEPALADERATVLGDPDTLHTYTYIEDFADALVTLSEHETALGEVWHVPSAETRTTRALIETIYEQAGSTLDLRVVPRWLEWVIARMDGDVRALREVAYTFREPFVVDHAKFAAAFGADPTPHAEAIRHTLEWYRTESARVATEGAQADGP